MERYPVFVPLVIYNLLIYNPGVHMIGVKFTYNQCTPIVDHISCRVYICQGSDFFQDKLNGGDVGVYGVVSVGG